MNCCAPHTTTMQRMDTLAVRQHLTAAPATVSNVTARDGRMLTALLAACDPCGWMGGGGPAEVYADTALEVVGALDRDADLADVVVLLPGDAAVEPAAAFARAAVAWWGRTHPRSRPHSPVRDLVG